MFRWGSCPFQPRCSIAAIACNHFRSGVQQTHPEGRRTNGWTAWGLGTLSVAIGQAAQAQAALSTAIAMSPSMAMTVWLPQTEAALGQVATRSP